MLSSPAQRSRSTAPTLPEPRGPLSFAVLSMLRSAATSYTAPPGPASLAQADEYGEDLQLALYCCYELHYRGFAGVCDDLEWDPRVLTWRGQLERVFLTALRTDIAGGTDVTAEIDALLVEPVDARGVSHYLCRDGRLWQLREYLAQRSLYHLKEADPHAFVIPRLTGSAKVALVSVEYDEYGSGNPERMHAHLYAEMMTELGLCTDYGAYLDAAPAATLAVVNFMSLCGLHRRLRGALIGQLAAAELTSSPASHRMVQALHRLGCGSASMEFYAEHIEADAVHEQLVRHGVITPLLASEPELTSDVVFGIQASALLSRRVSHLLLNQWARDKPALRYPLPDAPAHNSR